MTYLNLSGIDGETGNYLAPPMSTEQILQLVRDERIAKSKADLLRRAALAQTPGFLGLPYDVDPLKISQAGWALVFAAGASAELRAALDPLLVHRRKEVAPDRLKILEYRQGESLLDWLKRHNASPGNIDPKRVPYYLLLVGDPVQIPFDFQCLLDIEYAVGRLSFDHLDEYRQYVASIIEYETKNVRNARETVVWGTRHSGDAFTDLSTTYLTSPLCNGENDEPPLGSKEGFALRPYLKDQATKEQLLEILACDGGRRAPAVLFTASHGVGWPKTVPEVQRAMQGALLCQDWTGVGTINASHFITATEVPDEANVHGMIAMMVACYSAGIPEFDAFAEARERGPVQIAGQPFVSALPQRLLSHARGAALAVVGHIERIWSFSFAPPDFSSQVTPFRNFFGRIMSGQPVGHAMTDFNSRYGVLAADLLKDLDQTQTGPKPSDEELVWKWIERTDAQNFVVLGDPAARIRVKDLT